MIVYKTTCLVTGQFYVGQDLHNDPSYLGSGLRLGRAIKKYGREHFLKEVLQHCESKRELDAAERAWIITLNAIEEGYNLAAGGTGGRTRERPWNFGLTKESDQRVRLNGQKTGAALRGQVQSPATREKRAAQLRGMKRSPVTGARISAALRGRSPSEETRHKIAEALRLRGSIELKCATCGLVFTRCRGREQRRLQEGKSGPYCSRSCSATQSRGAARHGTTHRYRKLGCRCEACREAIRLAARLYRKKVRAQDG